MGSGQSPRFVKIRTTNGELSRVQDNVDATLRPLADAVFKTPIMGAPPPVWIAPDFLNGWANYGNTYATLGYHKDALGYVHVKGNITNTTASANSNSVFLLPVGFRPAETQIFATYGIAGVGNFAVVFLNGNVRPLAAVGAGSNTWLQFSFLAEQ